MAQEERVEVAVIGGGPAGLAAAATLKRCGIPAVVLERSEAVGASWRRHYRSLRLHTVRSLWVSRDGVVRYLEGYVRHHGLDVRTGVEVRRLDRSDDGAEWLLDTPDGTIRASYVVVATGYNHTPVLPNWPGRETFSGELIHGQYYRNPSPYVGRDVLVVGSGNTGAEIAVDLVEGGAGRVRMAVRTPPNVLLREANGVPAQVTGVLMRRLPLKVADAIAEVAAKAAVGDLSSFGLPPSPRGPFTRAATEDVVPILDVGLIRMLKQGRVEIVAAVEAFDGPAIVLADGSRIEPDAVIACAGYARGLEPLVGRLGLLGFKGRPVVNGGQTHPNAPRLYFIGYTNPISGMLREIAIDARRIARAVVRRRAAAPVPGVVDLTIEQQVDIPIVKIHFDRAAIRRYQFGIKAEVTGRLVERIDDPAPRGLAPARRAPDDQRLARDHAGDRAALRHRVGVHHPGHRLLVGPHVGGRDVEVGTNEQDDLGRVAPGEVLFFLGRELARVDADPALGPPVGQVHEGALPRHQHGQGADLAQVDVGSVAEAALGWSKDGGMVHPVTREYTGRSVVHPDRDRHHQGPPGMAQALMDVLGQLQPLGRLIQLGQGGPEQGGVEVRFLSHENPFR